MKNYIKNVYLVFLIIITFFSINEAIAKEGNIKYSKNNISNYFSGILSSKYSSTNNAYKYLNKVQDLKSKHDNYNIKFLRTLVQLNKFGEAFLFSKSIWKEEEIFFEIELIMGLNFLMDKNYSRAAIHFQRLDKIPIYDIFFKGLFGNVLNAWTEAFQKNKKNSFNFLNRVPSRYMYLGQIQNSFMKCHYNLEETQESFLQLIESEDYNFSRYNFFLINYLLHINKDDDVKKIILKTKKEYNSNLLIQETENFFLSNKSEKIKNLFDCQNPSHAISEFFYIIANLYASEEDYELSNFFLNISLFLNKKFEPNKALLAENFYYEKKYDKSKDVYNSLKSIGPAYSWHSSKNIASILDITLGKKQSIRSLKKDFNLLKKRRLKHYYDLANFYKDKENFQDSVKYYSLALEKIDKEHELFPKILERRGSSYERLGEWEKAEKDLSNSLKISPDEPYVLNYLAYSWIEKRINLDKSLEMLKRAVKLKKNDGYIIDSLGWSYYVSQNYIKAEKFLQEAVELKPLDPIINDHYADTLWMLNKKIQARYFWNYILDLDDVEEKLKKKIKKKLIFGITSEL